MCNTAFSDIFIGCAVGIVPLMIILKLLMLTIGDDTMQEMLGKDTGYLVQRLLVSRLFITYALCLIFFRLFTLLTHFDILIVSVTCDSNFVSVEDQSIFRIHNHLDDDRTTYLV